MSGSKIIVEIKRTISSPGAHASPCVLSAGREIFAANRSPNLCKAFTLLRDVAGRDACAPSEERISVNLEVEIEQRLLRREARPSGAGLKFPNIEFSTLNLRWSSLKTHI